MQLYTKPATAAGIGGQRSAMFERIVYNYHPTIDQSMIDTTRWAADADGLYMPITSSKASKVGTDIDRLLNAYTTDTLLTTRH